MIKIDSGSHYIKVNDGVSLHYFQKGEGKPIVLLHGWSQTASMFAYQIEDLSRYYRVIALDMRGHGLSEKPNFGYRIQRLAKDLNDVLASLDLQKAALLGHSMGSAVIWSYCELFGVDKISHLIFIDQQACMVSNPRWRASECQKYGATLPLSGLVNMIGNLDGANGTAFREEFILNRFTQSTDKKLLHWVAEQNGLCPLNYAVPLFFNHAVQDWRDVIEKITLPTLIITGEASNKPLASMEWIRDQIPGSKLEIFPASEGGEHFMFLENPDRFNRCVINFLGT